MCNTISRSRSMPNIHCGHNVNAKVWDFASHSNLPLRSLIYTLQNHPHLEELNLSDCDQITDAAFEQFIGCLDKLKKIALSDCTQITDRSIILLAQHCPHMIWIDLAGCTKITDVALHAIANAFPKLEALFIANCDKVTDYAIRYLSQQCWYLRWLDISRCSKVTHLGLLEIAKHLPHLVSLGVRFCPEITGYGLQFCSEYFLCLQDLSISSDNITDEELAVILKNCISLNRLEIPWCTQLTARAFNTTLPKLRYLDIQGCAHWSEADFKHIDSCCPHLYEIVWQDESE